MKISSVYLKNFRNIEDEQFESSPYLNFIIGDNGQGKTNIIEAIYLLTNFKSFRKPKKNSEIINWDNNYCEIGLKTEDQERKKKYKLTFTPEKKSLYESGVLVSKWSTEYGYLNSVLFTPDNLSLLKGGPEDRRRFIDRSVFF